MNPNEEAASRPCCGEETREKAPEAPAEGVCPACARHTARSEEVRRKLVNRLSRIEGQIRGIRQMIERDAYCNDVLIQSAAAGAALNAFNRELVACHLRTCVARDLRDGRDEVIDELTETLQKLMK